MTERPVALIIDDEEDICTLLRLALLKMGVDAHIAYNCKQAYALLGSQTFSFCLTDLTLPDGSGMDIVATVNKHYPHIPIAVISAYGSMDTAIEALKIGAFDFVSKPLEISRLKDLVQTALKVKTTTLKNSVDLQTGEAVLLGATPVMVALRTKIAKLARSQAPVFIYGESGSGKEVAARLLHQLGPRSDGAFVAVNCGAIPSELMESEFFGHKKGSFTGATEDKIGLFERASGGTLFLDEVADLPLAMQVKLLRVIQEKSVRPIGGHAEVAINVRILSATHKDLPTLVIHNQFRQDLFYRINVIELCMPPLRERLADVPMLVARMLSHIATDWGLNAISIDSQALEKLMHYHFAGNVRELHNILERAVSLCDDGIITKEHIVLPVAQAFSLKHNLAVPPTTPPPTAAATNSVTNTPPPVAMPSPGDISLLTQHNGLERYIEDIEKTLILQALEATDGNKTAAAKKLGISFRTIRYKLQKLGLDNLK